MTSKAIKEALNKVSNSKNETQNKNVSTENNSIYDSRIDFQKLGYEDGFNICADYHKGFRLGIQQGMITARNQVLNSVRNELIKARNFNISEDITAICDNFPQIETSPIFSLPKAS